MPTMYRAGVLVVHEDGKGKWYDEIETSSWSSACNYVTSFVDMWTSPGWKPANVWIRDAPRVALGHSEPGQV
jgi:hypothetical protein